MPTIRSSGPAGRASIAAVTRAWAIITARKKSRLAGISRISATDWPAQNGMKLEVQTFSKGYFGPTGITIGPGGAEPCGEIGVPARLGTKLVANEFVAFVKLPTE